MRDSLCVWQVPSHLDSLLPPPLLSSSAPFPLFSSADWCAIHGGPISPFSVLRPLATIHANEVEQMTFFVVGACMYAGLVCVCVCGGGGVLTSNLSCFLSNHLTVIRFFNGYAETIVVFSPEGTKKHQLADT